MTESEWLASSDPEAMLREVSIDRPSTRPLGADRMVSDRKLRLFACGCCRQVWSSLIDPRSRAAVEVAERFADGLATEEECEVADSQATDAVPDDNLDVMDGRWAAAWVAAFSVDHRIAHVVDAVVRHQPFLKGHVAAWAALLRDIIGNPFRPATFSMYEGPVWSAPDELRMTIFALARAAYEERSLPDGALDPVRLAILADALTDAGCPEDGDIVQHLRLPGSHGRGCWALDLILGRD